MLLLVLVMAIIKPSAAMPEMLVWSLKRHGLADERTVSYLPPESPVRLGLTLCHANGTTNCKMAQYLDSLGYSPMVTIRKMEDPSLNLVLTASHVSCGWGY